MFVLNVMLSGATGQIGLCFEDEDGAWRSARTITDGELHTQVRINDQRGQSLMCRPRDVLFLTVLDLDKDMVRQADLAVLQHTAQVKLEKRIEAVRRPVIQAVQGSMLRQ